MLGVFLGTAIVAYAVSSYFTGKSFEIRNTKGTLFTIDLTDEVEGTEVLPGTDQTVNASIENTGTEKMYVFVGLIHQQPPAALQSMPLRPPDGMR